MLVKLLELTQNNSHPFGNVLGREVFKKLQEVVDSHLNSKVFEISLEGIIATDSSFPRESVVSLAKLLRGEKWFYLSHIDSVDLIDNWDYAAKAKQQSLLLVSDTDVRVIGSELNSSTKDLLDFVLSRDEVSTASVAKELNISVQNASTRLKKLVNEGLILRSEETSLTGGIEFLYSPPQLSA